MAPRAYLSNLLRHLPERHVDALRWFEENAGREVPWPQPLGDGTLLVTKAKGIYKPEWSQYALSVRQSLDSPYPDRDVEQNHDGTWQYKYFQESLDVGARDTHFTNRGLLSCYRDTIPVGVLHQTRAKPNARYKILGLAMVNGFEDGFFVLDGLGAVEGFEARDVATPSHQLALSFGDSVAMPFDFASSSQDDRQRAIREVRVRQGQAGFRRQLLDAYDSRCAVTRYDATEALEAAHIVPYRGPVTNHAQNGLLLRSDLHSLFDLGLIGVHEESLKLVLSPELRMTQYSVYEGTRVFAPASSLLQPSRIALAKHRQEAGL